MDDVATSLVPRKRKRAGGGGGGDRPIAAKGERVMKFFQCTHDGPGRYYEGTLEALPSKAWPYYHIVYDDGDQEELASDEFWAIYSYWRVVKKALRPSEFVPDDRVLANDGRTGKVRTFCPSGAESVWSYLIHYDHTNANKAEWVDEVDLRPETKWNVAWMKKEQAKLAGRAKSQDEKAPPGRKMNEAGKREEAVAHSTEARKREEAKKARPVAQTCTVKGCSKWRISGCNGMCMAHSIEAGNPVSRPVAQTCAVKGCSKRRQYGCNGMCIAHSKEARKREEAEKARSVTIARIFTLEGGSSHKSGKEMAGGEGIPGNVLTPKAGAAEHSTGTEHAKIKKSCRADECLTQSNGDGGATRGTVRSPDGTGNSPYSSGVVYGDAENVASAVNHATRKPPWTVPPPARVVDMSDNRPKPTFEDVDRLFGTDDGDDSDRFYLSSI